MKNRVFYFLIGGLFLFTLFSCGEDVDSYLEPDQAKVITAIELQKDASADIVVPDSKPIDLTIIQTFNDGSREPMSSSEMKAYLTWEVASIDGLSASKDPDTGKAKVAGEGEGELKATILPGTINGFKHVASNALTVKTTARELIGIDVRPAENYSVGCQLSDSPSNELLEGCLMQFEAFALYNNDEEINITDDDAISWNSDQLGHEKFAELLTNLEVSLIEQKPWYELRSALIESEGEKKGLVLGYNEGGFRISAGYGGYSAKTDILSVADPELYSLGAHIITPDVPKCGDNCLLYENTSIQIEAFGKLKNGVESKVTPRTQITSDPVDASIDIQKDGQEYTGFVEIHYGAPGRAVFAVELEGHRKEIGATISREQVIELRQKSPGTVLGDPVSRKTNAEIYFLLDALYNNDDFTLLDAVSRRTVLNTQVFHTWEILQGSPKVLLEDSPVWEHEQGHLVTITSVTEGTAQVRAHSDSRTIVWDVSVNNDSKKPKSLTINPGNSGSIPYNVDAGVLTQFSVMAAFDNLTSKPLENNQIMWDTSPDTCFMEMVNPQPVRCIDDQGRVNTYDNVSLIATTVGFDPDISTDIQLNVISADLTSLSISPAIPQIFGRDSSQFNAIGHFSNGRSHVLPGNCLTWTTDPAANGSISNNPDTSGFFTAMDVPGSPSINLKVISGSDCNSQTISGWNILPGYEDSIDFVIQSLPDIQIVPPPSSIPESGEVILTFRSSRIIDRDITVPFSVTGSAISGVDYQALPGYVTIPASSDATSATLSIIPDLLDEYNESIIITLLSDGLVNGRLAGGANEQVEMTISDDDPEPELTITLSQILYSEGDTFQYTFELDEVSGRDVSVDILVGGVSSEDYEILDVTGNNLIFPAGTTEVDLSVRLLNDGKKETDESLSLNTDATNVSNIIGPPDITVEDIDTLQFSEEIGTITCEIGTVETVSLAINANPSEVPYTVELLNAPSWITLLGLDSIRITPEIGDSSVSEITICINYDSEGDCQWFNVNVTSP